MGDEFYTPPYLDDNLYEGYCRRCKRKTQWFEDSCVSCNTHRNELYDDDRPYFSTYDPELHDDGYDDDYY